MGLALDEQTRTVLFADRATRTLRAARYDGVVISGAASAAAATNASGLVNATMTASGASGRLNATAASGGAARGVGGGATAASAGSGGPANASAAANDTTSVVTLFDFGTALGATPFGVDVAAASGAWLASAASGSNGYIVKGALAGAGAGDGTSAGVDVVYTSGYTDVRTTRTQPTGPALSVSFAHPPSPSVRADSALLSSGVWRAGPGRRALLLLWREWFGICAVAPLPLLRFRERAPRRPTSERDHHRAARPPQPSRRAARPTGHPRSASAAMPPPFAARRATRRCTAWWLTRRQTCSTGSRYLGCLPAVPRIRVRIERGASRPESPRCAMIRGRLSAARPVASRRERNRRFNDRGRPSATAPLAGPPSTGPSVRTAASRTASTR